MGIAIGDSKKNALSDSLYQNKHNPFICSSEKTFCAIPSGDYVLETILHVHVYAVISFANTKASIEEWNNVMIIWKNGC